MGCRAMPTHDAAAPQQTSRPRGPDRDPIHLGNGVDILVSREHCPDDFECYVHIHSTGFSCHLLLDRVEAGALAERLTIPF